MSNPQLLITMQGLARIEDLLEYRYKNWTKEQLKARIMKIIDDVAGALNE